MKLHLTKIIFSLVLIGGCNMSNKNPQNDFFKPNWKGLNLENFSLEFGEEIELESHEIRGLVLDFSKDEGGKWYGVCFINKEETLCDKKDMSLNPVNECYFQITKIEK